MGLVSFILLVWCSVPGNAFLMLLCSLSFPSLSLKTQPWDPLCFLLFLLSLLLFVTVTFILSSKNLSSNPSAQFLSSVLAPLSSKNFGVWVTSHLLKGSTWLVQLMDTAGKPLFAARRLMQYCIWFLCLAVSLIGDFKFMFFWLESGSQAVWDSELLLVMCSELAGMFLYLYGTMVCQNLSGWVMDLK